MLTGESLFVQSDSVVVSISEIKTKVHCQIVIDQKITIKTPYATTDTAHPAGWILNLRTLFACHATRWFDLHCFLPVIANKTHHDE